MLATDRCHKPLSAALFILTVGLFPLDALRAEPPVLRRSDGAPGEYEVAPRELGPIPDAAREIDVPAFPVAEINGPFEETEQGQKLDPFLADDDKGVDGNAEPAETLAEMNEELEDDQQLDEIDHRAPVERAKQAAWKRLSQAIGRADWDRVPEFHERLTGRLDKSPGDDSAIRGPRGALSSARLEAARLIAKLPEDRRALRARELDGDGKLLIRQALASGDARLLEHVAAHLFGTEAGFEAASRLVTLLFDRGHFALADRWLAALREAGAPVAQTPPFQNMAAFLESLTSRRTRAADAPMMAITAPLRSDQPTVLNEWTQAGGDSRRHARQPAGEPSLIERWQSVSSDSLPLLEQIDRLSDELAAANRSTIPAGTPLLINGRMICRTLRGIEVLDVETGRPLWAALTDSSLDQIFRGGVPDSESQDDWEGSLPMPMQFRAFEQSLQRDAIAAGGPLEQALFHNGSQGVLSGDRQRVYFLDDDPVYALGQMSFRSGSGDEKLPRRGSDRSNWLRAFDLASGHSVWRIGGPGDSKPDSEISPDLRGWFFLGTPLADRGELLVIAQRDTVIRLFCLEAESGAVRWSQPVGSTDQQPDRDLKRRMWSVQPSVAHGVVVCPTATGWLIGIDRSTGTLLWGHRYAPQQPTMPNVPGRFGIGLRRNPGLMEAATESTGSRWLPSAPIIAGNRIYVTPTEGVDPGNSMASVLACLDLFDGKELWRRERSDELYVAGVCDGQPIVVRGSEVQCLNDRGRPQWEVTLDPEDGAPSGRAVLGDGRLWLPVQKSGLIEIETATGRIVRRLPLAAGDRPLGSLAFYRGQLISYHPTRQRAFELRDSVEARIKAARKSGRETSATRLLAAQLALSAGDVGTVVNILRSSLSTVEESSGDAAASPERFFAVLTAAIAVRLDDAPDDCLKLIEALQKWATTPQHERQRRRLLIEAFDRLNRPADAFRELVALAADDAAFTGSAFTGSAVEAVIKQPLEARVVVTDRAWLSGRLQFLWPRLPVSSRMEFQAEVVALLARARSDGDTATAALAPAATAATASPGNSPDMPGRDWISGASRIERMFGFMPDVRRVTNDRAIQAESSGEFALADRLLNDLSRSGSGSDSERADALLRRLKLHIAARRSGLPIPLDAIIGIGADLLQTFGDGTLPDGRNVRAAVADAAGGLKLSMDSLTPQPGSRPGDLAAGALSVFARARLLDGGGVESGGANGGGVESGKQAGAEFGDWSGREFALSRSSGSNSVVAARPMESPTSRWIVGDLLRVETTNRVSGHAQFNFVRETDDSMYWSVTIPTNSYGGAGRRIVRRQDDLVVVLQRGMLTCLSLADRRVLWSRPVEALDSRGTGNGSRAELFVDNDDWLGQQGIKASHPWPVFNSQWMAICGRRSIEILDTATGELRWRFEQPPRGTRICGTDSVVVFTTKATGFERAFAAIDGRPLDREWADALIEAGDLDSKAGASADVARSARRPTDSELVRELLPFVALSRTESAILSVDANAVVSARLRVDKDPDTDASTRLDPESYRGAKSEPGATIIEHRRHGSARPDWSREYAERSDLCRLSTREIAVYSSGEVELLDLETGQTQQLERIGTRDRIGRDRWSVLRDHERIYLVAGISKTEQSQELPLRALHDSGTLFAFSARTGQLLWSRLMDDEFLVLDQFRSNPVLLLMRVQNRPLAVPVEATHLTVLDKATGRVLLQEEVPGECKYQSLHINRPDHYIDLISQRDRLRLTAQPVGK